MPIYSYTAKDESGKITKGTVDAEDQNAAYRVLKQRDLTPVKLTAPQNDIFEQLGLKRNPANKKVSLKAVAIFARQFATILRSGVPIIKCLDILRKQTEDPALEETINRLYEDVQKGVSLSKAMEKHGKVFSTLFVSMVEVGEVSGTLDNSLEKMATQLEKDLKLQKKLSGALTYPITLAVIAFIAVVVLMVFVVPQFKVIFEGNGSELPGITMLLLNVSDSFVAYWYVYIGVIVTIIVSIKMYKNTPEGKAAWDAILLKLPVVKDVQRKTITAKFARVSATMLGAGVSLLNTIEASEKVVGNVVAQQALKRVQNEVRKGGGLRIPIAREEIFPPMLSHMVGVGEESGSLDEMLEKTADFFEDEVDASIDKVSSLVEPAILLFMAIVVGGIVLAIMVPMLSMSSMY